MSAGSRLFHPVVIVLIENLLLTATAAFTPKDSPLRLLAFFICIAISWQSISTFHDYIQTTGWPERTLAGAIFSIPNVLFDRLLLRKWEFGVDYLGPIETSEAARKKQSRWDWASEVASSQRCVGSEKEVLNVPHFSEEDPEFVPTRTMFLIRHSCLVVGLYYLNIFVSDILLRSSQSLLSDAHIPFLSRLPDVSIEEIVTRIQITVACWTAQYCYLQLFFSLFAIINVSLKPAELKLWRPLYGSIKTSYTIRNFWGKFWHQCIQLNVKGPAEFITHSVLRIPYGTILARYTKIFFAFFVSGAMHVAVDSGGAVSITQSGSLSFFCAQSLGILLEDSVQELYRKAFGDRGKLFCKIVGYVWVLAFLSWSTPFWVYPVVRTMKREDMMLSIYALHPLVANLF